MRPIKLKRLAVILSITVLGGDVFPSDFISNIFKAEPDSSIICQSDMNQVFSFGQSQPKSNSETLKLFVWNVAKYKKSEALHDLFGLAADSDIIFVQEAAHSTAYQNAFEAALPSHIHQFYQSFCDKYSIAFGVQISTSLISAAVDRWPSPDTEPFSTIRKMSGYSYVEWNGQKIHLINTHALNFNAGGKFERQIDDLFEKIKRLEGPIMWAGDFNTWIPLRKNYLFSKAAQMGLLHVEPGNDNRKLVLDHIFYRGLNLKSSNLIEMDNSDHEAIITEFTR